MNLRSRWLRRGSAAAVSMALLLSACAANDDAAPDGPEPAAAEDDPADEDAWADVPETVLRVQSVHAPGAAASKAFDAWADAVADRSDGKLTFELFYAGALAPLTEVEEGLASGLIDIATHAPAYNPAQFPLENTIQRLNSAIAITPLAGTMQGIGAQTEFAFDDVTPPYFEERGLQPLLVPAAVVPAIHLACAGEPVTSLADASGTRVRVPSEPIGAEATAVGMTPTATTIAELFESLDRGVVDCVLATPPDMRDLGLFEVIDHWVIDPEVMFSGFSSFHLSMSQGAWDGLPDVAKRLLWDTAGEVFLRTVMEEFLADTADAIAKAADAGIEFHVFEGDLRAALADYQRQVFEAVAQEVDSGPAFVDRFTTLHEQWLGLIGELGYDEEVDGSFEVFSERFPTASLDLGPFIDHVNQTRSAYRP
jgi:TRAP-type C4-dicarboxylate transport system substrate-binding protein